MFGGGGGGSLLQHWMYCITSMQKERVWPLWHGVHGTGWNVDMTNEISARVIMNNFNVPGMGDQSGANINWRCLE